MTCSSSCQHLRLGVLGVGTVAKPKISWGQKSLAQDLQLQLKSVGKKFAADSAPSTPKLRRWCELLHVIRNLTLGCNSASAHDTSCSFKTIGIVSCSKVL